MAAPAPFRRRWPWVTADLQTLRNDLPGRLAGIAPDSGRRIEIPLSDESGDRLAARFHPGREPLPAVILVPGLTGCEASRHVLQSAGAWAEAARRWSASTCAARRRAARLPGATTTWTGCKTSPMPASR